MIDNQEKMRITFFKKKVFSDFSDDDYIWAKGNPAHRLQRLQQVVKQFVYISNSNLEYREQALNYISFSSWNMKDNHREEVEPYRILWI